MHIEKNVGTPLLMATTIAGGTLAYADPVRFENDGSFEWVDGIYLDITRGVSKQTGIDPGQASFQYQLRPDTTFVGLTNKLVVGFPSYSAALGYPVASVRQSGSLAPNDFMDHNDYWRNESFLGYYYSGGFYTQFDDSQPVGIPGAVGYIAVRFELDGATHYGWLSLTLTRLDRGGRTHDLLAWGYETDPNTPIEAGAVPSPSGALALLAFGAAAGMTRARRS